MPFQPGHNLSHGRPPIGRALTDELRKVLDKPLLAHMINDALTTGVVTFPDGTTRFLVSFTEWSRLIQWVYNHVDGPPRQEIDVNNTTVMFTADEYAKARSELEVWRNERED